MSLKDMSNHTFCGWNEYTNAKEWDCGRLACKVRMTMTTNASNNQGENTIEGEIPKL